MNTSRLSLLFYVGGPAPVARERVESALAVLEAGTQPPYEVIMVENTDQPNLVQFVKRRRGVRALFFRGAASPGHALNQAARTAAGEVLGLFLGPEALPPQWDGGLRAHLAAGVDLAGRTRQTFTAEGDRVAAEPADALSFLAAPGLLLTRAAWESLGGLDETLPAGLDADLCWRAQQRGLVLRYVPCEGGGPSASLPVGGNGAGSEKEREQTRRSWAGLFWKWRERVQTVHPELVPATRPPPLSASWPRTPLSPRPPGTLPGRVLLCRSIGLGDVILSTIAARALKERYPHSHVTFATRPDYLDLLRHVPDVDEVVEEGTVSRAGFDRVYDFNPFATHWFDFRPGEGQIERLDLICQTMGLRPSEKRPRYMRRPEEEAWARGWLAERDVRPGEPLVGITLAGSSRPRTRSPEATAALLTDLLTDRRRVRVILLDRDTTLRDRVFQAAPALVRSRRVIDACGQLTVTQLTALLAELDVHLTTDTGPLHLAALFDVPQLAFFSEIHPQARISYYRDVVPLYDEHACLYWPCTYTRGDCPKRVCIDGITYADLKPHLDRFLDRPAVSVIVLVHNQLAYTQKCLATLRERTRLKYELVVVDNGSTDETPPWLATQEDVRVIRHEANESIATCWNTGLRAAQGRALVLLNNDIEILPGGIDRLVAALKDYDLVGQTGGVLDLAGDWRFLRSSSEAAEAHYVEGYAFALRRSVLAAIGWFDERFEGAYCEDSDFGLRARQAGLRLGLVPGAVYHYGSVTTRETMDVDARSRQNAARLRAKYGVGQAGASVLVVRQGARGDLLMLALALRSFVRTHPGTRVEVRCAPECAYILEGNPDAALASGRTAYAQTFDLSRAYEDAEESGVWKHPVEHFCAALGVPVLRERYPLYLFEGHRARAAHWLSRLDPARPRVGVGLRSVTRPMSSWRETRWLALVRACPEINFILLDAERNPSVDNEVSEWGPAPELFTEPNVLNLTGQTRDLKEVGAVLEQCQTCVSVDTAILHVAHAVGCPVVGLFAGLPPAARLPLAGEAVGLAGSAPCYPCTYPTRCPPDRTRHCLDGIEPEEVAEVLQRKLAGWLVG